MRPRTAKGLNHVGTLNLDVKARLSWVVERSLEVERERLEREGVGVGPTGEEGNDAVSLQREETSNYRGQVKEISQCACML